MSGKRARRLRKIAKQSSDDPHKRDRAYRILKKYWKNNHSFWWKAGSI